jgi:dolichol-phosphate mannosyltransferase
LFGVPLNDFTNAFKAYRRTVIEGCRPFSLPAFQSHGGTAPWTVLPITWRNRRSGLSKLKIREMAGRYLFLALYCWLEKYFSRGDYKEVPIPVNEAP